jgi:hypothetical protein
MTAQSKSVIKTYFQTGDRPTQAQFVDFIDSYQDVNSNLTALASAGTGAVGLQLLATATTVAAQAALGSGTVGRQIFACATTAAASAIIGGGDMTKAVYDPANINQQVVGTTTPQTVSSKIVITATASAASTGFRLPHGAAPSAPTDGDMWTTTSGLAARINGVTVAYGAPQFTLSFTSSDQTITSAGPLTLAHGLGVVPKLLDFQLVCQTAEQGYSIADVTGVRQLNGVNSGITYTIDATNVFLRYGSDGSVFQTLNKTSGAGVSLTNANWRLRVKAWA